VFVNFILVIVLIALLGLGAWFVFRAVGGGNKRRRR
jgi:hypothetical protein